MRRDGSALAVTRRTFLFWMGSVTAAVCSGTKSLAAAQRLMMVGKEGKPTSAIGQHFSGETLEYAMGFLWFKNAASCTVTFRETPDPGVFEAIIAGQTHGIIGAFTRFRRDIVSACMEEVDNGTRLRPLEFCEDVIVGSKHRKKSTRFDYENHQIVIVKERKGAAKEKRLALPAEETYYDPITASYNFRFGSFGPIERGRSYVVKTVPEKELTEISVTIASRDDEEKQKRPSSLKGQNAYFVFLQLDKDIINSSTGKIEGWLSSDAVPIEGRVRDVLLFGDIVGRKKNEQSGEHETGPQYSCR